MLWILNDIQKLLRLEEVFEDKLNIQPWENQCSDPAWSREGIWGIIHKIYCVLN